MVPPFELETEPLDLKTLCSLRLENTNQEARAIVQGELARALPQTR